MTNLEIVEEMRRWLFKLTDLDIDLFGDAEDAIDEIQSFYWREQWRLKD